METYMRATEEMIEKIVITVVGTSAAARQSHFLRESLRHLVRLAQLEKEADVKRCVALSLGMAEPTNVRRVSKVVTRKLLTTLNSKQGRLDFQSKIHG
jgi:hypothetical protein